MLHLVNPIAEDPKQCESAVQAGFQGVQMNQANDRLWRLQCRNEKCKGFFDYFGPLRSNRGITYTLCGKSTKHVVADFVRYDAIDPSSSMTKH